MAVKAQQLLEHSLLSELRAVVARALSGLEMFAGNQLTELDLLGAESFDRDVAQVRGVSLVRPLAEFIFQAEASIHAKTQRA